MTERSSTSRGVARRGLSQRTVRALCGVLGAYATFELLAWIAMCVLSGGVISPSAFLGRRDALRQAVSDDVAVGPDPRSGVVVHPFLGFVLDPAQQDPTVRWVTGTEERRARYPVNAFGFLGRRSPIRHRVEDDLVIGIVGGSVAMVLAERGTQVLEATLRESPVFRDKSFRFVNLAVPGHKQPQQLMTVAYLSTLGGEFDWIINIDGFNEVALYPAENAPKGVFAAFPRGWSDLTSTLADPRRQELVGAIAYAKARAQAWDDAFSKPPLRYSLTAALLWRLGTVHFDSAIQRSRAMLREHTPDAQSFQAVGPPRAYATQGEMLEDLVSIWERSSSQIETLATASSIEYFHFLQPNQYAPGAKALGEEERRVAYDPDHPYRFGVEAGYPLLARAGSRLRDRGVRFTDLTRLFADVERPLYIDPCCHLNQEGNDLLARAIARSILAQLGADDGGSSPAPSPQSTMGLANPGPRSSSTTASPRRATRLPSQ